MRLLFFICFVVALVAGGVSARRTSEKDYQKAFTNFVTKYNKSYPHDEFFSRYEIFKSNYDLIRAHNSQKSTYTMGVNAFADLSLDEFVERYTGYVPNASAKKYNAARMSFEDAVDVNAALPTSVDWRTQNAVSPVKNQGQCGSCWAFSTTGSVEGAHAIATKSLISLSEQQLVDCSTAQGNQGCNGGLMDQAFTYIEKNNGICLESAYPYTGVDGTCQTTCTKSATISSYVDLPVGNETALLVAAAQQPVSIAIEADQSGFQLYTGGVFTGACGTALDHGVLVAGFGTDNTVSPALDYWLVKNSWGAAWGESGYIRLVRGINQCGLTNAASFPVV